MTIEISLTVTNPKVASSKAPAGVNAKPVSAESGQTKKSPGFMAILAAADESTPAGLTLSDSAVPDGALVPTGSVVDITVPGNTKDAVTDAVALLAQTLQWTANPMGVPLPLAPDPLTMNVNGAATDVGPAVASATLPSSVFGTLVRPLKPGLVPGETALSTVAKGPQGPVVSDAVASPRKGGKDAKDTISLQSVSVANAGNLAVEAGRAEDRSIKPMALDMFLKPDLPKIEPVLQMVAATAKREEHSIHGAAKANAAMDIAASWGGTAGAVGGSTVYSAVPVADTSALTPEYLAEQVSYWISNDVQSAEMKLQGLGESPVEVRISMVGNEAHVTFRTDEAQARDALENASAHLKEMLQRDGVVLSGVSVGTSGSGGADRQEPQPHQERQKAVVVVEAPTSGQTRTWGEAQTGRALDLFV